MVDDRDVRTAALVGALGEAGHRVTSARRQVATLIDARQGHFAAADLVADAHARSLRLGRATVFRALDLFAELGLVERLALPTGEHAYVRCEPSHHHHVVCSNCGRTAEVEDCGMTAVAVEVARRTGYRIETHRLELFGLCPACAEDTTLIGAAPLSGTAAAPNARNAENRAR